MKNLRIVLLLLLSVILYSCGKEIFIEPVENLSKSNNRIAIKSNPTKALIYLNNRNTGIYTPDTLKWLDEGKYSVTIRHPYFIDTTITLNVSGGSVYNLDIDHYKNPGHMGKLSCSSSPEKVDVTLDNVPTNKKTPTTFTGLMPGEHKVKYSLTMHRSDSANVLVVGGQLTTLYLFLDDTTKGLWYNTTNSKIPTDNTYNVAVDSSNVKWIGSGDGLIRFDGKNWKSFNRNNSSLTSNVISCLFVDKENKLWIGIDNGLFVYNGVSFVNYSQQVKNFYISSIAQDGKGTIWIAAIGGLFKFDGTTWQHYTQENSGLGDNYLYTVTVDKQNSIWVGTNGFGVVVFDGVVWRRWDMSNMGIGSRIGDVIVALSCDKDGWIWAAHMREEVGNGGVKSEGGLSRFNGTRWNSISVPQINTQYINSIHTDRNNNKWISTKFGLGRFDKNNNAAIFTKVNGKLQSNNTTGSALDKTGDLYISTIGGGISKFRKGLF